MASFAIASRTAGYSTREQACIATGLRAGDLRVRDTVARQIERGQRVLHVSSHSFTPVLNGVARRADIGLLYDSSRAFGAQSPRAGSRTLRVRFPALVVRRNYPYRGTSDDLTTSLRERFGERDYAGIELEVNQKHSRKTGAESAGLRVGVARALRSALAP